MFILVKNWHSPKSKVERASTHKSSIQPSFNRMYPGNEAHSLCNTPNERKTHVVPCKNNIQRPRHITCRLNPLSNDHQHKKTLELEPPQRNPVRPGTVSPKIQCVESGERAAQTDGTLTATDGAATAGLIPNRQAVECRRPLAPGRKASLRRSTGLLS